MKAEIIKNELGSIPGAQMGSYILGAMSACHDPQNFSDFNLLRALKTKMGKYPQWGFEHPFQYSYAVMALCSSRANFGKRKATYRDNIVDSIPQQLAAVHSINSDTLAMQTLALSCLKETMKRKGAKQKKIIEAIKNATDELKERQMNDSTFGGNEVTAALAAQVSNNNDNNGNNDNDDDNNNDNDDDNDDNNDDDNGNDNDDGNNNSNDNDATMVILIVLVKKVSPRW